jgi:L,D-peptidoglycan transpeptidase YkuD (ErfK/YbiS/YcfS/YnhG family)
MSFPCALGEGGIALKKREGDGLTPLGIFALRRLHYRADHVRCPPSLLAKRRIKKADWWCDDPQDRSYNSLVTLRRPPPSTKETLWRKDHLYDLIIEIGFNDRPTVKGKGSGIFFHLARSDFSPTKGCVAVSRETFLKLLRFIGPKTKIKIG